MLQESRKPNVEWLRQFLDWGGAYHQSINDGSPGGVGESMKRGVKRRFIGFHVVNYIG